MSYEIEYDNVQKYLNHYTKKIDKFDFKKVYEYDVPSHIRDDVTTYDTYIYKINFEFNKDKKFKEFISYLENEEYEYNYSCIIDDGKDYVGEWKGVDNNYLYKYPHDVTLVLEENNSGKIIAVDLNDSKVSEHEVKYNVTENGIKLVVLDEEKDGYDIGVGYAVEYLDYKYTDLYELENDNLTYIHYGEKIVLEKTK